MRVRRVGSGVAAQRAGFLLVLCTRRPAWDSNGEVLAFIDNFQRFTFTVGGFGWAAVGRGGAVQHPAGGAPLDTFLGVCCVHHIT